MFLRPIQAGDLPFMQWKLQQNLDMPLVHASQMTQVRLAMICEDNGTVLKDRLLFCELIGAVTVPRNEKGEYGLIENWRPIAPTIESYSYPHLDVTSLGTYSLEFPRGLPRSREESGEHMAAREAEEETGYRTIHATKLGTLNINTAFFPGYVQVYLLDLDQRVLVGQHDLDIDERIRACSWHSAEEVEQLIAEGKIVCSMTLAAFLMARVQERRRLVG